MQQDVKYHVMKPQAFTVKSFRFFLLSFLDEIFQAKYNLISLERFCGISIMAEKSF